MLDQLREECGVFGIYDNNDLNVAKLIFFALYSLQHRGQESCGIAVNKKGSNKIDFYKEMGLLSEVFNDGILDGLQGNVGIGHVRYSTAGGSIFSNAQPMVVTYRDGMMAVGHNGNLVNDDEIRREMGEEGSVFTADNDTELIVKLLSKYLVTNDEIEKAIETTMQKIKGAYAVTLMMGSKLIAFRDPLGIRPLCLGKIKDSYVVSSESCAFSVIGAEFIRDINPGEIIIIDEAGLKSFQIKTPEKSALCIFEYVYFARPDSYIDGVSVHQARLEAGKRLAIEHPVDADLVIGVPDSALSAALGYARESGIPYGHGLIRNRYVGRTFIQPSQDIRDASVKIKFSALKNEIEGKRIVMLDDSIVRGTTMRIIVQMLKDAGAKEVHLRISSPPVRFPCYYGIDTPSSSQLIASNFSIEEIREKIDADSLAYLSLESLLKTPLGVKYGLCDACFSGNYCITRNCCK